MFTGIVQAIGKVTAVKRQDGDLRASFSCGSLETASGIGDSIAVNGVCLTVVANNAGVIDVDISRETLACTTLGDLQAGDAINLEKSLLPGTPLGGHFVSGHVDGVGSVSELGAAGSSLMMRIAVPRELGKYIAVKGSICVDGVSLTVNGVARDMFEVNIIPHTRTATILGGYSVGTRVNVEVDIIARYLERLLTAAGEGKERDASSITGGLPTGDVYPGKRDSG